MRARVVLVCAGAVTLSGVVSLVCARRALDEPGGGPGADAGGGAGAAGGGGAGGSSTGAGGSAPTPPASKLNGASCAAATECASGFCVGYVCCDSACTDVCMSCGMRDFLGTCAPIPAGQPPGISLACTTYEADHCGFDGTCDGAGSCHFQSAGAPCGSLTQPSCSGDTVIGKQRCDGQGNCLDAPVTVCVPYTCDPVARGCRTSCVTDADCTGTYCETTGRCHVNTGTPPCAQNADCASGFCVAHICCDTACNGPCMSCNVNGRTGTCSPQPDGCAGADAGGD